MGTPAATTDMVTALVHLREALTSR